MFDLRKWLVNAVAGDIIQQVADLESVVAGQAVELASVASKTPGWDNEGWQSLQRQIATEDRPFDVWESDVAAALNAWRENFLARQIVRLTTNYVIGDGIGISSEIQTVEKFIRQWWNHPLNHMDLRLPGMCDELTRSGELYPVLYTHTFNGVSLNGMSYIRFRPARWIDKIEFNPEDLEDERRYHQRGLISNIEGKWWRGRGAEGIRQPVEPLMLHYAINRPIGATRGEGDLVPVLAWLKRYTAWVKDRIRLNRVRVESGLWDVTLDDDTLVKAKKEQYKESPPEHGSVMVHGKGETWKGLDLHIDSADAKDDGKVIRLAVAAGSGNPLHFFGEGESATKATAAEMGGPTFRHFRQRQIYVCWMLKDIVSEAYRLSGKRYYSDLKIKATVPDIEKRDNKLMAQSAHLIVRALRDMKAEGWITDELAVSLAFKFAGEILSQEEIKAILAETGGGGREQEERLQRAGRLAFDLLCEGRSLEEVGPVFFEYLRSGRDGQGQDGNGNG